MKMHKTISLLCIFGAIGSAQSVQMTPQIQSLLAEKARKIEELEKCDSKRKAFVIAGISTLGLTAVGVGGNIALANKNKKLDAELSGKKSELASKKMELSTLQYDEVRRLAQELQSGSVANTVITTAEVAKEKQPGVDEPKADDTGVTLVVKNADGVVISNFDVKCSGGDKSQQVHVSNKSETILDSRLPDDANCEISSTGYTTKTITIAEIKKANGVVVLERTKTAVEKCLELQSSPEGKACCYLPDSVAKWQNGKCVCQAEKTEFKIENGKGKCVTKEEPPVVLDASVDGTGFWYNSFEGGGRLGGSPLSVNDPGDWVVKFPDYNVKGVAVCNNTSGAYADATNAEQYETGGVNCWCKMTHPAVSRWVFNDSFSSASDCAAFCAGYCGSSVQAASGFRSGVFGSVAN